MHIRFDVQSLTSTGKERNIRKIYILDTRTEDIHVSLQCAHLFENRRFAKRGLDIIKAIATLAIQPRKK